MFVAAVGEGSAWRRRGWAGDGHDGTVKADIQLKNDVFASVDGGDSGACRIKLDEYSMRSGRFFWFSRQ